MARTKPFLLLILSSISFTGQVFAQEKRTIDSVMRLLSAAKDDTSRVMLLLDYGGLFAYTNMDSSEFYYRQAKQLTDEINFYHGKRKYITYQSEIFNLKGQFDSSIHLCREGIELAKEQQDERFVGVHLNNLGNAFLYQGINDSAAFYLLQVPEYFEKTKEDKFLGILYSNLGVVFSNLDQPDQSIHYNRLSMQLAKATGDDLGVGYAMVNIGSE
jgi:tetratricopeptide (TPR) repeat protein